MHLPISLIVNNDFYASQIEIHFNSKMQETTRSCNNTVISQVGTSRTYMSGRLTMDSN